MRIGIVCYASVGGSGVVATELAREPGRGADTRSTCSAATSRSGCANEMRNVALPPRRNAGLSAVSRAAVRAVAVDQHRPGRARARASTSSTRTTRCRTPRARISRGRFSGRASARATCRRSSRRCTAPTSRWSAATRRTPRRSRSASISPTASPPCPAACATTPIATCRIAIGRSRSSRTSSTATHYAPRPDPALRARLCPPDRYDGLLLHVSNLRPVKRLDAVVDVFRRVRDRTPREAGARRRRSRARARRAVRRRQAQLTEHVEILGEQDDVRGAAVGGATCSCCRRRRRASGWPRSRPWPAALPVVASRVGGLPEVIDARATPASCSRPDDTAAWRARLRACSTDRELHARIARAARAAVVERFCEERIVPQYEAFYERLLGARPDLARAVRRRRPHDGVWPGEDRRHPAQLSRPCARRVVP